MANLSCVIYKEEYMAISEQQLKDLNDELEREVATKAI